MGDQAVGDGPLVSAVVPTYNRDDAVREAVESVREQTYDPIELVVVDDHSETPVEPLLAELDLSALHSVRCIRHEENRGANAARNTGIDAASGEFVAFLDDDDRWLPEKVQRQVRAFETGPPDLGLVTVGARIVDEHGEQIGVRRSDLRGDVSTSLLYEGELGSFSRVMVRASVVERAGTLDEAFPSWQDREWYLRIARHCTVDSVEAPLVERRIASHEQISDDFEAKRDVSYPRFLEKHRPYAADQGPLVERRFVASLSRTLAFSALSNGHYRDAVRYLGVALAHYPLDPKALLYLPLAAGGPVTFEPARRLKRSLSGALGG